MTSTQCPTDLVKHSPAHVISKIFVGAVFVYSAVYSLVFGHTNFFTIAIGAAFLMGAFVYIGCVAICESTEKYVLQAGQMISKKFIVTGWMRETGRWIDRYLVFLLFIGIGSFTFQLLAAVAPQGAVPYVFATMTWAIIAPMILVPLMVNEKRQWGLLVFCTPFFLITSLCTLAVLYFTHNPHFAALVAILLGVTTVVVSPTATKAIAARWTLQLPAFPWQKKN
jgi:hypothetical protein